jgi:hypothetical protein
LREAVLKQAAGLPARRAARPPRPVGQVTRGKTARGRLRQTDTFLAVAYPEALRHTTGLYIDLGYGAFPVTTLETLQRLRRLNPALRVLGVEIDPERVAAAKPHEQAGLEFRLGGFNLPLRAGEQAGFIRAFNVLRQYPEAEVENALAALGAAMEQGGLLLEGTCDPPGRLLAFNLYEKREESLEQAGFVFAPRPSALRPDFDPRAFRAVLPKNYIHHAEAGGALDSFFAAWHAAWGYARRREAGAPRRIFAAAALRLADHYGCPVDRRPALLRRGFLMLGPAWLG